MSRYLKTAAEANAVVRDILSFVPAEHQDAVKVRLAQLVNLGFRCNPRAAHSTIRLNSVQGAMKDTGVNVRMVQVRRDNKSFNALDISLGSVTLLDSLEDSE